MNSLAASTREGQRVAVIGAGYVGLPTAATLAHFGHRVVLAENQPDRLAALQRGEIPIVERGLEELVQEGRQSGRLQFMASAAEAVEGAQFVFLCVPTPQSGDGSADLSMVRAVTEEIREHLISGAIVVNKSTVPVGTSLVVAQVAARPDVSVVSNPEFLREGTAVSDSLHPDRLVLGSADPAMAARVGALFAPTNAPLIITDAVTAETIKYASNAFLATKLSFVNSLATLCDAVGADVRDLILGLGYDKRIGFEFSRPGPGWGGSCLPKDTSALLRMAEENGFKFDLLGAVVEANEDHRQRIVDKVTASLPGGLSGSTVAVLGLTFKAGTDDRRASPAIDIAQRLRAAGANVRAFDPTVSPRQQGQSPDIEGLEICADPFEACRAAEVVAVLTEWEEFRNLNFEKLREVMAANRIVDARNLLDPISVRRLGFTYVGLGRP